MVVTLAIADPREFEQEFDRASDSQC